jgi:hypothetical protein
MAFALSFRASGVLKRVDATPQLNRPTVVKARTSRLSFVKARKSRPSSGLRVVKARTKHPRGKILLRQLPTVAEKSGAATSRRTERLARASGGSLTSPPTAPLASTEPESSGPFRAPPKFQFFGKYLFSQH